MGCSTDDHGGTQSQNPAGDGADDPQGEQQRPPSSVGARADAHRYDQENEGREGDRAQSRPRDVEPRALRRKGLVARKRESVEEDARDEGEESDYARDHGGSIERQCLHTITLGPASERQERTGPSGSDLSRRPILYRTVRGGRPLLLLVEPSSEVMGGDVHPFAQVEAMCLEALHAGVELDRAAPQFPTALRQRG